jgi:hypothetical protein
LDPDDDPFTPDAPHVVNNSWTFGSPGCNLDFDTDLQSLAAAGVVSVFAAGNFGPDASPANNPGALPVGATDNGDAIYANSSRGPTSCSGTVRTYPAIVAPGMDINTTDRYGLYTAATGTSLAAPHVSAGLALLLTAYPDLTVEQQRDALASTAVDLGPAGADNTFGNGRLDLLAAYQTLSGGGAIFADGFESGDLSAWSVAATGGGKLTISTAAAINGAYGLQARIDNPTPIYVADLSPAAEASYHARFYFTPNSVSMNRGQSHDIFVGRSAAGEPVFRLQMQYSARKYQFRALALEDVGAEVATGWAAISNAAHAVEIAWQAASSPAGTGGALSLWIDGKLVQSVADLANGGHRLEEAHLGPGAISPGVAGTEYYDAFVSTRNAYIGP